EPPRAARRAWRRPSWRQVKPLTLIGGHCRCFLAVASCPKRDATPWGINSAGPGRVESGLAHEGMGAGRQKAYHCKVFAQNDPHDVEVAMKYVLLGNLSPEYASKQSERVKKAKAK